MKKIHEYFIAERNESISFLILAAAGIFFGFYLMILKSEFYNGLVLPLLFIAIFQLINGVNKFFKTKNLEKKVMSFLKSSKKSIRNIEIPRIKKLSGIFKYYRYIEAFLMVLALFLYVFSQSDFWKGIALGVIIECGTLYVINYFTEYRTIQYLKFLKKNY